MMGARGLWCSSLLVVACAQRVASSDATSESSAGDEGFPEVCDNPDFTCRQPGCADSDCGPLEPFAADGCLHRTCADDSDCVDGDRCYRPAAFGRCDVVSTIGCEPRPQGCVCTVSGGQAAFCVDASEYPSEPENPCASGECGAAGSHSHVDDDVCYCDDGFGWCVPEDIDDFACCQP